MLVLAHSSALAVSNSIRLQFVDRTQQLSVGRGRAPSGGGPEYRARGVLPTDDAIPGRCTEAGLDLKGNSYSGADMSDLFLRILTSPNVTQYWQ